MNTIAFAVEDNSNIYTLPLGESLAGFMEFNFDPFYSKCRSLAENALRTRVYDEKDALLIKDLIRSCHPFFTACYSGSFDDIVLDCVIDIICLMEGGGLEALWARNISAEDSLGKTLFSRISEYKMGRAVNQWTNLQRMQKYARKKTGFIFSEEFSTQEDCELRAMYFDLSFSSAAQLAGCDLQQLPAVRCCPPALLPGAPKLLSPATALVEPVVQSLVTGEVRPAPVHSGAPIQEQLSGMLCVDLMSLPLPDHLEMISLGEKLRGLPRRVYLATGLKAIIDLELDELLSRGLMLWLLSERGRYTVKSIYSQPEPERPEPKKPEPKKPEPKKPEPKKPEPKKPEPKKPEPKKPEPKKPEPKKPEPKKPEPKKPEPKKPEPKKPEPKKPEPKKPEPKKPEPKKPEPKKPEPISKTEEASAELPMREKLQRPDSIEGRMELLQNLAADKQRHLLHSFEGQNVDVLCQSVHTSLLTALREEWDQQEEEIWAKHLFRIRGGIMSRRYTKQYLFGFLDATIELYELEI